MEQVKMNTIMRAACPKNCPKQNNWYIFKNNKLFYWISPCFNLKLNMQLLFTLFIIALSFFLLSLGTMLANKRLKGSCGGNDESCSCSSLQQKMCKTLHKASSKSL